VLRRGVLTAILILALITAFAVPLNDPEITVPYTVQGGFSTSYTAIPYVTNASVGVTKPTIASYASIAGVSTSYTPMVYRINTELVVENIKWSVPLRVHVRLLKANKTYIPDFDVDYTVNGTQRTARRGEDSLNITFNYFKAYWKDPVVLVFPDAVEGHRLLNSTTIIVDPLETPDVYVYYYAEVTEPAKPVVPTVPEEKPEKKSPWERGYIFIPWWLIELVKSYWWLLLLLAMLVIALYVYQRRREEVSVEIHIPKWAY
jgi:hypothetical protein